MRTFAMGYANSVQGATAVHITYSQVPPVKQQVVQGLWLTKITCKLFSFKIRLEVANVCLIAAHGTCQGVSDLALAGRNHNRARQNAREM